jgi:hypothetical protein
MLFGIMRWGRDTARQLQALIQAAAYWPAEPGMALYDHDNDR